MPRQLPRETTEAVYKTIKDNSCFIAPALGRYPHEETIAYLSPAAWHGYILAYMRTNAHVFKKYDEIPREVADEIVSKLRIDNVSCQAAKKWEDILRHDIRGVVRASQDMLSNRAKSYAYLANTSYDLLNTGQSLALKDFSYEVLMPQAIKLNRSLIEKAKKNKDKPMVGRTHLQHAAATTAGHYFGEVIEGIIPPLFKFKVSTDDLRGKNTGFVGTNAARKLLFKTDLDKMNKDFFELLGIKEDDMTGQIVHQHYYLSYFAELSSLCSGAAKFANDVRKYQQTEVGEMAEQKLKQAVGSSTGAHKKNPIKSENTVGQWRQMIAELTTVYQDTLTDFQRDLRDSSNKRHYMYNMGNIALTMLKTSDDIASNMTVRTNKMAENLAMTKGLICAEPLQLYLQKWIGDTNSPFIDAHEYVQRLTEKAVEEDVSFFELIEADEFIQRALRDADAEQRNMILIPEKYIGTAIEDVERKTELWETQLLELEDACEKHKEFVFI